MRMIYDESQACSMPDDRSLPQKERYTLRPNLELSVPHRMPSLNDLWTMQFTEKVLAVPQLRLDMFTNGHGHQCMNICHDLNRR